MKPSLVPAWVLLALLTLAPAAAQEEGPGANPHPPPPSGGVPDAGQAKKPKEEKGPNLQVPKGGLAADVKKELEAAISLWEKADETLNSKGAAEARHMIDDAVQALEAVRPRDGACVLPEYYLGIAYQIRGLYYERRKDLDKAVVRLKTAVRLLPSFHEALVELGDSYRHVSKETESEEAYDQAIAHKPDYMLAYRRRADLHFAQEKLLEAREDIRGARLIDPDDLSLTMAERQLNLVIDGPDWPERYDVETKNYLVRTNVSQEFAQSIADNAELIRKLYLQVFPDPPRSKRKFPIVVFKSRKEYHENGGPQGAGGHFDPLFKQLFLFKYRKTSDTLLVLYHEGFHQFLDRVLEHKPPQWFNEGLADFFGPATHVKKRGEEGMKIKANPWRLGKVKRMIRKGTWVRFDSLMTMSQAEMYGQDVSNHYAQAWSMVYFFIEADDRAYFKYLKKYFKALRKGKNRLEAFDAAFGRTDLSKLEQRWREFMMQVRR